MKLFPKPLVASLCGTFLKPEMQSVYRQITGLERHRTVVLTEKRLHAEQFPFEPVAVMQKTPAAVRTKLRKQRNKRRRGNFIRRFYYKHLLKQWPPPERPKPVLVAPEPVTNPEHEEPYNLVALLREYQPALAHVYYGHKAAKYLSMLRRWGGPVIVSFHGLDVTEGVYKSGMEATLADVFAHSRLILARSQSLLDRLADLGCPHEKLRLNRASIPLTHIPRSVRCAPLDGKWVLLQACRLIGKKGLATTLRGFREVINVEPRARLVLAGDGPLAGELQEMVQEMGLSEQVRFAGWCSQEELFRLYTQAHIFLHPSETTATGDQEGVPNSLLEAMASGLPAIGSRHGGIPEAIIDGADGVLVSERSPAELATAILDVIRSAGRLESLSIQAPLSIERKFGAVEQLRALEDCYAEAISGAARK